MKIGMLQEGEIMPGVSYAQRYEEMIREVVLADEMGFHCWGTSEQKFSPPRFTVSAPEVLYAAVARETRNIKLRIMCSVLLQWNHPLIVAERLATLDIVSGGRAELGTARSNNLHTLSTFGVEPSDTKPMWADSLEVLAKAMTSPHVSHDGPYWSFQEREIVPYFISDPHPPIYVAASSAGSCREAGQRGIGAILFESYFGFDYMQECIDAHAEGVAEGTSMLPDRVDTMGLYVASAFCDHDRETAMAKSRDVVLGYAGFIAELYAPLAKNNSYEYLDAHMARFLENRANMDFLTTGTPSVMVGTPEDFIARLKDLQARGIDEVLLRIDGMPHDEIMESIRLIGEEVIPAFAEDAVRDRAEAVAS
ncbi:LLM class flavin-dependent oxidoreductase [Roseovarius sp. SK2]|uniref:LLM class flavin-dependent oxidoreductase n=1 Tax=Roseovarius sp. SK2 TaxID=3028381 RepID=UPI00237AE2AD|nr:LLM class flavin-dependent oxidoreductase [Roseovarius sp. SK2]MDD9727713.1 LLM class flavin-dependent oxidoreductase [Roseovarius sp. SK2]